MMSMYGSLCWCSISLEIEEENVGVFEIVQKHWNRPSGKIRHNLVIILMSIFYHTLTYLNGLTVIDIPEGLGEVL